MVENIHLGNTLNTLYKDGILKLNTKYKVRLKTLEECKKILGKNLKSSHGMVSGFKENILQSSKDSPLDYTIRLCKYTVPRGINLVYVEIIKHPKAKHDYVGCGFEPDLFEYTANTDYKTRLEL